MLKLSKIIPIPKNGDERVISNYRPLSILSVFSKILEKIMYKRLISYLHKNILSNVQFGFRQGKSTELACYTFLNNIQEAIDKKYHVIGLFLDLTKAYDILNHQILLEKLDLYGIRGITNKWFHFHLSNRIQIVEITHVSNNNRRKFMSSPRTNFSGVPQGSILGPLLFFIIYKRPT
jgi:retron-type reverse transcriptase